jgi:hypothetical protein
MGMVFSLSEKHRMSGEAEIDFDRLARIGNKLNEFLVRKTKGTVEAYAVLRFMCAYYEEDLGISFEPEFEEELRKVVRKSLECAEPEAKSSKPP